MAWNMYDFFTMYADVDGWEWQATSGKLEDPSGNLKNPLDQWAVSRVHQLTERIDKYMQVYDIPSAMAEILPFLDDASNWYVRRSRRRFWRASQTAENDTKGAVTDTDKDDAYKTLHYILVQFAMTVAPFTPFLAEELFQKLTGDQLGESVHLLDWPEVGHINELVLSQMADVRLAVEQGLSQRAANKVKVRQPLQSAKVWLRSMPDVKADQDALASIIHEELNVKDVFLHGVGSDNEQVRIELDFEITPQLKREGVMREVIRVVQTARKQAGLQVDDRISLSLETSDSELAQTISEYSATIMAETLATQLESKSQLEDGVFAQTVTVEGKSLNIALAVASA
jgi:isoleucyl-tRNA synthetase